MRAYYLTLSIIFIAITVMSNKNNKAYAATIRRREYIGNSAVNFALCPDCQHRNRRHSQEILASLMRRKNMDAVDHHFMDLMHFKMHKSTPQRLYNNCIGVNAKRGIYWKILKPMCAKYLGRV